MNLLVVFSVLVHFRSFSTFLESLQSGFLRILLDFLVRGQAGLKFPTVSSRSVSAKYAFQGFPEISCFRGSLSRARRSDAVRVSFVFNWQIVRQVFGACSARPGPLSQK